MGFRLCIKTLSILLLTTLCSWGKTTPPTATVTANMMSMPLAFTANQGQWPDSVLYRANAGRVTMWFTKSGAYYQFTRTIPVAQDSRGADLRQENRPPDLPDMRDQSDSIETMMIKAHFVGSNPHPQMVGEQETEYKCNYFLGNDPAKWRTDVPNYQAIVYKDVYDGIDLKYYGNGKQMEYDFLVSPGSDPSHIRISYEGAKSLSVNETGELVVETEWGTVTERRPVVYQLQDGKRKEIVGEYQLIDNKTFSFRLSDNFDKSLVLVIDPTLVYSTYLGGNYYDYGYGIAIDVSGATYVTGETRSSDFPTQNPYQGTYGGDGYRDVFVTKLSSDGNSLVYSTYLGGWAEDAGYSIAVDVSGAAYVTGWTGSIDFPIQNPYQSTYGGSHRDAFIAKLSSGGDSLIYSTYLGGNGYDHGYSIAVDISGAVYVTGSTGSTDFPSQNPYQSVYGGGSDVFITKLSSDGNSLIYSTYLGGGSGDAGYSIAIDASRAAYITGYTTSSDFPTQNPYQSTYGGGYMDVFITKLSSSGNSLIYSTYLGGNSYDEGDGIAVDASETAYVIGYTSSLNFPTQNPYQSAFGGGNIDVFITRLSNGGNSLVYSTYLGGNDDDHGYSIAVDASGAAYVTGSTVSLDFPMQNPYQSTYGGGIYNTFISKLSSIGNSLIYSTYLGASGGEEGKDIVVDASGAVYVTGYTYSTDFPTLNPYQGIYQGSGDVFVTKLSSGCCVGIRGNVDSDVDDKVNVADVIFLANYAFSGGTPPPCLEEADVNGDSTINIGDVIYLANYAFSGGPAPVACP